MHPWIETQRQRLLEITRRSGVTDVRVFGSMACGDADAASDVDLRVTLPAAATGLAHGPLLMDAQELLGRRVDVITEDALHPALRERALADCVTL
jgi:hypothetical protein